jgi:hypothetical protein
MLSTSHDPLKMIDKNSKLINKNDLVKYPTYATYAVAPVNKIENWSTQIVFVFDEYIRRNPYEVEVITLEEAMLLAFEGISVKFDET